MTSLPARPDAAVDHARPRAPEAAPGSAATAPGTATDHASPAADVERWLAELALEPVDRGERDGVHSWDVVLDGRRRRRLRVTLILAGDVGLVAWAHYAPQLSDSFRKSYRKLLRWNDELPFAKFALSEDERIVLTIEMPPGGLDRDRIGDVLARLLTIADDLLDESAAWLWPGGHRPKDEPLPETWPLLDAYAPAQPAADEDP